MNNDIQKVLVSEEEIERLCVDLGAQITNDYKDKKPVLLGLLKGCVPFISDLAKRIDCPLQLEYMDVSSYHGTQESSGNVKIIKDIDIDITNRHILIVEDIVDTGRTLNTVVELLLSRNAASVEVVTLLDKPDGRVVPFDAKYIGVTIPKEFVVGYGLDYNELYRNLPYIGILKESVYKD